MKLDYALPGIAIALSLVLVSTAFAADEYNVTNSYTLTGKPLGMHGVDPVSMFKSTHPVPGNAVYTSAHDGVDYYFETAKARAAFDADPAGHLPQFGGFCALAVMLGKKLDGDARYADIVDGKLYLFVNDKIFQMYLADKENVLKRAHAKWSDIKHTAVGDL